RYALAREPRPFPLQDTLERRRTTLTRPNVKGAFLQDHVPSRLMGCGRRRASSFVSRHVMSTQSYLLSGASSKWTLRDQPNPQRRGPASCPVEASTSVAWAVPTTETPTKPDLPSRNARLARP